ncbi:MAG TPA: Smr/MutS family protein [Salinimicrobium sp.]|nr:Smr/MutS family protein [Salinimicrobium sp.]
MFKTGDRVAVLDDELEGKVTGVNKEEITIETTEGFLLVFEPKELVKLDSSKDIMKANLKVNPEVFKEKETRRKPKSLRVKPKERNVPPMEVDLHIHKLVASYKGMSNFDILNLQIETTKRQLEFAMRKRIQKIVFIHGVGEGVLKAELDFLLGRYDNLKFYDADYGKYGLGATEVYFFQSAF